MTLMTYVAGRVVTAYEPSKPLGRQMRPVVNGVSAHTKTSGTASPDSLRTRPRIWPPLGKVTSSDASDDRSNADAFTPSSDRSYQSATARTRSGGSAQTQYAPGARSAE